MTRAYKRHNREELEQAVKTSVSYAGVCRKLGRKPVGGTITNIALMCRRWSIDVSHMTGQAHNKGKRSNKRIPANRQLVMGTPNCHRISAGRLRKWLFEMGVKHVCNKCGIDKWNGEPLVLEIDHIDGQYWNNQLDNLQFLCPNCHSQKEVSNTLA